MSFQCDLCDKYYKSYKSLYTHKYSYHNDEEYNNINKCKYCEKIYANKYSLARHNKKCKQPVQDVSNTIEGNDNFITNGNNNINGYNNNNQYNNSINVIVNMGDENLSELLTVKEQLKILNKRNKCLEYIIQYIHCNDKFPQFKNVMISDLKSNTAFKFDSNVKDFIVVKKDELLDDLIENRLNDIEEFCTNNIDDVKKTTKKRIGNYISKIEREFEDPKSKFIKEQKKNLELTMYNARDMVKPIQKELRRIRTESL